ncbi:hypothetical protein LguiA_033737 [Lonicera macranthoides]
MRKELTNEFIGGNLTRVGVTRFASERSSPYYDLVQFRYFLARLRTSSRSIPTNTSRLQKSPPSARTVLLSESHEQVHNKSLAMRLILTIGIRGGYGFDTWGAPLWGGIVGGKSTIALLSVVNPEGISGVQVIECHGALIVSVDTPIRDPRKNPNDLRELLVLGSETHPSTRNNPRREVEKYQNEKSAGKGLSADKEKGLSVDNPLIIHVTVFSIPENPTIGLS